ncbi:MAG TPA: sterol desaturase family protein [Cyclobacteriaceae bacterium]|jgi:sterol desaturase/sphingolipid hydroxylase (fatty acid hydroxylase superfamily)|nr:sterol desaturase family protein [Cyclobacteriaceae bacterium]
MMDSFLDFFEFMPAWQKLSWVIGCLLFTFLLENSFPLVQFNYKKWKHAGVNFIFLGFTLIINIIFGIITVGVFDWISAHQFGLLFYIQLPTWTELILSVLLFDLVAQYTAHYLLHRIKWMWKMHMVHHSDTMVDATTGTRHHPGDYIVREVFALAAAFLIGAPFAFYMFYRICTVFFTYMSHANITIPLWLDKSLSLIFITPNMHKFHHHVERPWTDTNFGNIFSLWDRIFGTMVYDDPKKVKYGLDILAKTPDDDVLFQLKVPFSKNIKTDY